MKDRHDIEKSRVKYSLLQNEEEERKPRGCTDRLLLKLLNIKHEKLIHYQSYNNLCREFLGAFYGINNAMTSVVEMAYSLGLPTVPGNFFKSVGGVSWGAGVLAFWPALKFGFADAESHTATSQKIVESSNNHHQHSLLPSTHAADSVSQVNDQYSIEIKKENDEDYDQYHVPAAKWKTSKYHYYNDVFKTMSDYMLYYNTIEYVLDYCEVLPHYSQEDWVRPAVRVLFNCGIFAVAVFANGQECKNTVISMGEKKEDNKAMTQRRQTA